MIRSMVSKALPVVFALLVTAAHAQDVNWTVTLNAVGSTECEPLTSATVNGQPYDLSKGAGLSMEICPDYYINSGQNGYIFIQMPPVQPWNPGGDWYQWFPSPYTTPSQITRGTPTQVSGNYYQQIDTFSYEFDLTYYTVWPQKWNGTLVRNLLKHPCHFRCDGDADDFYFTDYSATAILTGTFPIPTAPATVTSLYRCGSDRRACLIADGGGPHCPRDLPNCKP